MLRNYCVAILAALLAAPAAAAIITARDLATLRDIAGLSVSPDGERVAFQTRHANPESNLYETAWLVVSTRGGKAQRLADAGDPIQPAYLGRVNGFIMPAPPVWSPDSDWIAYLRKANGRTQAWRAHIDGKRAEQLTSGPSDVRALVYSKDGERLLFETEPSASEIAAALDKEGRTGFLYDTRFFPAYSTHPTLPRDVDFGSSERRRFSAEQEKARRIFVYDIAKRMERAATKQEIGEFESLSAAPKVEGHDKVRGTVVKTQGGALAWTEARDPERQGTYAPVTVVARPVKGRDVVVCEAVQCVGQLLELIAWRNDAELLFQRREGESFVERVLYAWKPGEDSVREVLRTEDLFLDFEWTCAMGSERLICFYEQSDRPRWLVAVDPDTGEVETLYDPNPDFERFARGSPPQRIDIRTTSGVETFGYLVLPPDHDKGQSRRLPLVVVTYRCNGFLRGGTGDEYPVLPFAAAGFAVLCFSVPDPDYERLATMDSGAYQKWARGPGDPGKRRVQEALEAAVSELEERGLIDPARVGVTGLSFGGETVMYALFNLNLAAAIASGTEFGPASAFLYGPAGRVQLEQWGLDDPYSDRWQTLSIARNANKVRAPLLLNVADRELIGSLHPYAALDDSGRAVEMHVFPDEHHIKSQPAHRLAIYERNIDWMNFWLRGVEDPAPAKAEQYKRWRAMRVKQCALFKGDDAPWYCRP